MQRRVEELSGASFNSCLLNYYRSGGDHLSFHSDNESLYGKEPTIGGFPSLQQEILNCDYKNLVRDQASGAHVAGSASFGTPRDFILRRNSDHSDKIAFELGSGDVLIMKVIASFWDYINIDCTMPAS